MKSLRLQALKYSLDK